MLETLFARIRSLRRLKRIRLEEDAKAQNYDNVTVVFICQPGEWEIKALLLASSLRRWCGDAIELVACVPTPSDVWGFLSAATEQQLKALAVRQEPITNPWGMEFSHANKIGCLRIPTARAVIVFMDSDILCLGQPYLGDPGDNGIRIKLADAVAFDNDIENWKKIYEFCEIQAPADRYPMTVTAGYSFPFFNSGVMILSSKIAKRLADEWEGTSAQIRSAEALPSRRLWSDQLGLAVALQKLGIKPQVMDLKQNHPTHLMPLSSFPDTRLSHYHWPSVVREEPKLVSEIQKYVAGAPAIRRVLENNVEWVKILESNNKADGTENQHPRTLIITGISRSGTSYLCQLVDNLSNAVALNETPELVTSLQSQGAAWGLATYLRRIRRQVVEGESVINKVFNGTVITDTILRDELSTYVPNVDDENFTIAAKNTFAFLSSLPRIRRVLPNARIVICVRNPFDTIASWKTSFPHLLNADTAIRPVGNANDPWLSPLRSAELHLISQTEDLAVKRAMLWRYLAERVLEDSGNHVLVKYEDLVAYPSAQLGKIFGAWDVGEPASPMKAGRPRSKRDVLDRQDMIAISAICADVASELGVWDAS